jgi:putative inorganic carbon (hco3(-)) transporter
MKGGEFAMASGVRATGAFLILPLVSSALFSFGLIAMADTSATWVVLIICGMAGLAAVMWVGDLKLALLSIFLFTLPIEISKALTSVGSSYAPALQLWLSDVAFSPLAALWLFDKIFRHGSPVYWSRVHWIALLLLLWFSIEAYLGSVPAGPLVNLNHVKYFVFFVVLADLVRDPRYLKAAAVALACGLAAQLTIAALQFITGSELRTQGAKTSGIARELVFEQADGLHVSRLTGFFPHPNMFADYLTFVLPPLIVMLLLGRRMVGTLVWNISAVLSMGAMVALILALSRGGWIAFGCSLAFIFVAGSWFGIVRTSHLIALAIIAGSLTVGISAFFPAAIYRVILSDMRSGDARIAMIDQAWLIIEHHPLLGVGLGGYNKAAQTVTPSSWAALQPDFRATLRKGVVHNKYLLTLAETGPAGLMLFVLFLGMNVFVPFGRITWTTPEQFALVLGISAAILAQAVFYLLDHFSYDTRIALLYAFCGLMVGMRDPQEGAGALERQSS